MADGSVSEKWNSNLISEPWKPLFIDDKQFIVKVLFDESVLSYEFCISDLKRMWYEKIEGEEFQNRSKVGLTQERPQVAQVLHLNGISSDFEILK